VKRHWGRSVKVGLDDVARRILSGVSAMTLPPVGTKLRRGDMLVAVRCGARLVAIPSPVDGIVLERNVSLLSEPSLFEHEPYGHGWMLRVETDPRAEIGGCRGAASRTWLREESLRLTHFLEARLGMAAADGGTLTAPPSTLLSDQAWREAAESFLRQA
jgi:glycine cleavage system H protein